MPISLLNIKPDYLRKPVNWRRGGDSNPCEPKDSLAFLSKPLLTVKDLEASALTTPPPRQQRYGNFVVKMFPFYFKMDGKSHLFPFSLFFSSHSFSIFTASFATFIASLSPAPGLNSFIYLLS